MTTMDSAAAAPMSPRMVASNTSAESTLLLGVIRKMMAPRVSTVETKRVERADEQGRPRQGDDDLGEGRQSRCAQIGGGVLDGTILLSQDAGRGAQPQWQFTNHGAGNYDGPGARQDDRWPAEGQRIAHAHESAGNCKWYHRQEIERSPSSKLHSRGQVSDDDCPSSSSRCWSPWQRSTYCGCCSSRAAAIWRSVPGWECSCLPGVS